MARILTPLAIFATLAHFVYAGIEFKSPKAGDKLTGGAALSVEWQDGGDGPALSDLLSYELFLCAGGNDANSIIQLVALTTSGAFTAGNKAQGMVGAGVGASKPDNAYFLKMVSTAKTGGTLTSFSSRFSLTGMQGTFPDAVIQGMKSVTGTDGPSTEDATTGQGAANPADGDYDVEYTMQTGLTRYAPMQPVPPTKITQQNTSPLHPTSSVQIAKSFLPIPKVQTTITQSQTFSVSSMENTVAAAPHPSDDMAKFLNRWKD